MSHYEKEQERLLALWQEVNFDVDEYFDSESENEIEDENNDQYMSPVQEIDDENDQGEDVEDKDTVEDQVLGEGSSNKKYYLGKDNTKWMKTVPNKKVRTKAENIIKIKIGCVKTYAKNVKTPLECWFLFFDQVMMADIVKYTNQKIAEKSSSYKDKSYVGETSISEIKAVIGLLYLAGLYRSCRQNLKDLWATDGMGVDIFRSTMALVRFTFLLSCIRFDNIQTRQERVKLDKLAPIRGIFDRFVEHCQNAYSPNQYLTLDEKLEAFRGRCSFRQYIPNKPAKYGIKVQALVDARTYYVVNLEVYVGRQPQGPFYVSNTSSDIVERMVSVVSGTNRNITFDNWYTNYPIMLKLLKDHKLTSVGTIRKNKTCLPNEFKDVRRREIKSSIFGFQEDITLLSYVPQKNKNVLLMSTLHHDDKIDEGSGDRRLPELIDFYNFTKCGVDVVDELSATYSVSRNSRRWPLTLWYSLLNTAGINAQIIYRCNNNDYTLKRRHFLKQLGLELLKEYICKRKENPRISRELRTKIQKITRESTVTVQNREKIVGRCQICPRMKDRKTKYKCNNCKVHLCLEHAVFYCSKCAKVDEQ